MSADVFRFQKKERHHADWRQDELAQFYRVEATLNRSGLAVETDGGLSDEGDPWFVFCRAGTDDVILHFARCDGVYVIASPGLDQVAHGRDFTALIEALLARYAPFVNLAKADRKSVTLHPSALLFALVVTCLFHAERSEAQTASVLRTSHQDVVPSTGGSQSIGETERPASAFVGNGPNYSQVVAAVAAAIGSAVTFEQWQNATSYIATEPSDQPAAPKPEDVLQAHVSLPNDDQSSLALLQSADLHQPVSAIETGAEPVAPVPKALTQSTDANAHRSLDVGLLGPSGIPYDLSVGRDSKGSEAQSPIAHIAAAASPGSDQMMSAAPVQSVSNQATPLHMEAYQDVIQVIGGGVAAHEVWDTGGLEPQLIINLLETQTSGTSYGQKQTPSTGPEKPSQPTGEQTVSSVPLSHATTSSPVETVPDQSSGTVTKQINATNVQVEMAVGHFITAHPDYQLIDTNQEMIIYDPQITAQNASLVDVSSYVFSDGSSVVLVGLAHAQSTSAFL